MNPRRLVLLAICIVLTIGMVSGPGAAEEPDESCGTLCAIGCAGEGGCVTFRKVGCNCTYVCASGAVFSTVCGR